MTLRDADRAALVAHLAQRFPGWGARADVARAAGLGDAQLTGEARQSWAAIVALASERGQVARLLSSAAHARPEDAVLADLAAQAEVGELRVPRAEDPRQWVIGAAIAGIVVLVLGILALAGDLAGLSAPADAGNTPVEAAAAAPEPTPGVTERLAERLGQGGAPGLPGAGEGSDEDTDVEPAEDVDAGADAEAAPDVDAGAEPDPDVGADVAPTPPAAGGEASSSSSSPCPGPADEVVGYVYAGRTAPSGSTWTLPRSLNVRVDYPRRDNGWSSRATVVCTLRQGTRVRLDPPPVPVDGGAFWVPIRPGNLR